MKPRCKNIQTWKQCSCKKNPISGENLFKILRCFVEKVSNVAITRFLVAFFCKFWNCILLFGFFFLTISVFWAFYAVLLWIKFFVIYALNWVKLFWLIPCSFKKVVFCISAIILLYAGGSYYYHWMRDAGLSIKAWMDINDNDYEAVSTYIIYVYILRGSKISHNFSRGPLFKPLLCMGI